jgi:hypothetical protein
MAAVAEKLSTTTGDSKYPTILFADMILPPSKVTVNQVEI